MYIAFSDPGKGRIPMQEIDIVGPPAESLSPPVPLRSQSTSDCTNKSRWKWPDAAFSLPPLFPISFFQRQTTQVWERTRAEFQLMEDFMEKQKRELLAQVTEVYKEIRTDKNKQDLLCTRKLVLVQDVMYEMDEAIQSSEGDLLEVRKVVPGAS